MKKEYLILIVSLLLLLIPTILLGKDSAEHLLEHAKGDGAFEKWFYEVFMTIDEEVEFLGYQGSLLGRAIGGFGAMLTLGYMGFQMQSGDREWEIMPMLKPVFIGLILLNWTSFYQLIQYPFKAMSEAPKALFEKIEEDANDLRIQRFKKQIALSEYLIDQEAEREIKEAESSWVPGAETFSEIKTDLKKWANKMEYKFQKVISELLEALGLTILRGGTYLVFFIQKIWSYILIVLGPIAVGFALIPGFEASLNSWIAKFVNINLYTFIALTIINLGQMLIMSAYKMEINRLSVFVDSANNITEQGKALMPDYLESYGLMNSVLFTVVAYVITAIGVMMTPTIADAIVTAGGAGVMTKMKGNASRTGAVANATQKAGGGGARGLVSGAKSGVQSKTTLRGKISSGISGGIKGGYNGLRGKN